MAPMNNYYRYMFIFVIISELTKDKFYLIDSSLFTDNGAH